MNRQTQLEMKILARACRAEFALDELMEAVQEYRAYGLQAHLLQEPVELRPNNPTEHALGRQSDQLGQSGND
jgi:hypothetical protein